jgi:hypothetical protein
MSTILPPCISRVRPMIRGHQEPTMASRMNGSSSCWRQSYHGKAGVMGLGYQSTCSECQSRLTYTVFFGVAFCIQLQHRSREWHASQQQLSRQTTLQCPPSLPPPSVQEPSPAFSWHLRFNILNGCRFAVLSHNKCMKILGKFHMFYGRISGIFLAETQPFSVANSVIFSHIIPTNSCFGLYSGSLSQSGAPL